jgi:hypothetical protein
MRVGQKDPLKFAIEVFNLFDAGFGLSPTVQVAFQASGQTAPIDEDREPLLPDGAKGEAG